MHFRLKNGCLLTERVAILQISTCAVYSWHGSMLLEWLFMVSPQCVLKVYFGGTWSFNMLDIRSLTYSQISVLPDRLYLGEVSNLNWTTFAIMIHWEYWKRWEKYITKNLKLKLDNLFSLERYHFTINDVLKLRN